MLELFHRFLGNFQDYAIYLIDSSTLDRLLLIRPEGC